MRLGLLGGTFDPVHVGHLDLARAAEQALNLDRVWFIPARVPPHRRPPLASAAHRFAMAAMAVASEPNFQVSDVEMDTDGPSYTADTLDRLRTRGVDLASVFFVTGADAFRDIPTWKDYPAILDRCHFVVVSRQGTAASTLRAVLPDHAPRMIDAPCAVPAEPSIFLVDATTAPVSSTDVRRALLEREPGGTLAGIVPEDVAAHIRRHGLYAARPGWES